MQPGVSLNPHTPWEVLRYVLPDLHHVLVMSVNPGFGGQSFIDAVLPKISELRSGLMRRGSTYGSRSMVESGNSIFWVSDAGADVCGKKRRLQEQRLRANDYIP